MTDKKDFSPENITFDYYTINNSYDLSDSLEQLVDLITDDWDETLNNI